MTISKKNAVLVTLLVALAAGGLFWWQLKNAPAPAPTPTSTNAPASSGDSLVSAMQMLPDPSLAIWGEKAAPGEYFIWAYADKESVGSDSAKYVGYTVWPDAGKVTVSLHRNELVGSVTFSSAPNHGVATLFATHTEDCWEGCGEITDYFDVANGMLKYSIKRFSFGGGIELSVDEKNYDIHLVPEQGCAGAHETGLGEPVQKATATSVQVGTEVVPFEFPISLTCYFSEMGGGSWPPFGNDLLQAYVGRPLLFTLYLPDDNDPKTPNGQLDIPLDPFDLTKAFVVQTF